MLNMALSLLIWLPVLGGVTVLALPKREELVSLVKFVALAFVFAACAISFWLYSQFDFSEAGMQFVYNKPWISFFSVNYHLGVDGISFPLILLTNFITLVVIVATWNSIQSKVKQYFAAFLMMQGLMIGAFCAQDTLLFYLFWEAMLIPMYLIIGIWGSANRLYAAIKFFLYTFVGSVLMLVALIVLYQKAGSFAFADLYQLQLDLGLQKWLFVAFFLAFAVKIPMWPVHTWLPDAHTEAPAGGSVILAAIMLKMGAYGFLRFSLPIVPEACQAFAGVMIALSLVAVVYISFVAIIQKDMKRLIAYSSIAHMGLVTLGCFLFYMISQDRMEVAQFALEGALIQMIAHGFSSGALFIIVGILYERMHTRLIADFGGVTKSLPILAAFTVLFAMANVGLPGTSGFVGEFMVIVSSFEINIWVAALTATTLILAAAYTLWMVKRVFFGKIESDAVQTLAPLQFNEVASLVLLAVPVIVLGVYPELVLEMFHPSVERLLELSQAR